MKQKRPSIKDIAKALNVSITTISFVLNGKGEERKISKEVIKKIEDYVEEINYRPNQVAQSLRTGKSKILVFMVEDIGNRFFAKIARIIEDIAYEKGYKVLFCSNENNDKRSRELIRVFHERQVDGFLIIPSPGIKKD
ncbi:MAG: LacI family DNA-binding transcriptional regulator, partial [Bacteroidota bacterium]|nr:LacI family DNA-binding transcriptional regulator [Bacteroidota bacterium]